MRDPDDPRVGDLSEGAILRRILAETPMASDALVGPGDDAAVIAADGSVVATTDTLVHGPDFRLAWSSADDLGFKAAAVNLADVAAMGARPTALLVALAVPRDTRVSFLEGMARGLRAACDELAPGCAVVGGDLTTSATLTIAVTALGSLDGRRAVLRSGAQVGDTIAVAGKLGPAARGIALLFERSVDAAGDPVAVDESSFSADERGWIAVQRRPRPPVELGIVAAEAGATAMMDVSDGLAMDAARLADASSVTLEFALDRLGDHPTWAIDGGEDHALLATFPADRPVPAGFVAVGRVVSRSDEPVLYDGRAPGGRRGWDPYRDWDERSD